MWTIVYGYCNKLHTYYIIVAHSRIVAELDRLRKRCKSWCWKAFSRWAEDTRHIWGQELRQRKQASRLLGGASTTDISDRQTIVYLAVYKLVLAYLHKAAVPIQTLAVPHLDLYFALSHGT